MSPNETVKEGLFLEYPREALAYYREQRVARVICEETHMGSHAVVVVCRNSETAKRRFRVDGGQLGACFARTGRPFFGDQELERVLMDRVAGRGLLPRHRRRRGTHDVRTTKRAHVGLLWPTSITFTHQRQLDLPIDVLG